MSVDDTPICEDAEEVVSFAEVVYSSLDVPLWRFCHVLHHEADRLVKKTWNEVFLPKKIEKSQGDQSLCVSSVLLH